MSFKFNSDKEQIRANAPEIIGDQEISIRSGTGTDEKEVLRALIEPTSKVPRVGINRTGNRIDNITVTNPGSGYTTQPTVTVSAPQGDNPIQGAASAVVSPEGRVTGILIDNPGAGYTSAPIITISGGNGVGATADAFLDTVDFELDINGAIRTSTSIISDTARILNLDIDNLVTPDAAYRAPNLKTFMNNTGTPWAPERLLQKDTFVYRGSNVYQSLNVGTTAINPLDPPLHTDGIEINGNPLDNPIPGVQFKHIGFRVSDPNEVFYNTSGDTGVYPRSITPLLGDKSDKIATTEYVLNLATNDVGGRIYVSQLIGDDNNDGRSPVNPVRTIKKACQLAWETPGVKESIIVAGGDYTEDNPMSLPPDASVVGDNLRLVIIRPANPRKHIFKFGDKNYVIGVTYRDQEGADTFTWDFAMVFDDKQRITYDFDQNGDFGTQFPVGHQIFGESVFRTTFQSNGGLNNLVAGIELRGVNAGGIVTSRNIQFDETTGPSAYVNGTFDFVQTSGSVNAGETLVYAGTGERFQPNTAYNVGEIVWTEDHVYNVSVAGTSGEANPTHDQGSANNGNGTLEFTYLRDTYSLVTTDIISIRPEGEVVFENRPNLTDPPLPISRIDFSLQGDPSITTGGYGDYGTPEDLGGIVFYTNPLVEADNIHDFKEGEEILIENLSTSAPDLSFLNGKQRIYKVIEDPDGRSRRFVIPKKAPSLTQADYDPGQFAQVRSFSKSVTLSLLNSPFKFQEATWVARRFQDACNQIKNNREFIADEVVGKVNDQFKKEYYSIYEIGGASSSQTTPTDVTYDAATGDLVLTKTAHGFDVGTGIVIADNSLTFTCAMDNNATEHSYPRSSDPASGRALPIISKTNDTFTVNVGISPANVDFTPQSGTSYNPATGDLVLEIGAHSLPVGGSVTIDNDSLFFTCDMDNRQAPKSYPRGGIDPASDRSVPITAVSSTSITVNIGASAQNKYFQPTAANYNPNTGLMTLDIGQHGLGVGRNITIENDSLTFTCLEDPSSPKTYPRSGIDPYADKKSIPIVIVGRTQHDVTDAPYNAATGNITLQVSNHGFSDGDYVKIADGALSYTCVLDGNTVTKTYPRAGYDPASNRWLEISNVTQNTFDVNVGQSSYTGSHTYVGGTSSNAIDHQTGEIVINVGTSSNTTTHTFVSATANAVKHEPQSTHYFETAAANSVKHRPQVAHTFVRSTTNSLTTGGSSFRIFLGTSRFVHTYISGGTVTFAGNTYTVTNFQYDNFVTGTALITVSNSIPNIAEDSVIQLADVLVECDIDGVTTQKTYPSFSIPVSDEKCRRDIRHFLNALCQDLEYGSNNNIIDAAKKYIDGTNSFIDETIDFEIIQTVRAIEYARELAIFAMRKWRTGTGLASDPVYTPVYSSLPRYFDPTVIDDTSPSGACNNVKSAIDTLAFLFVDVLANDASGTYLDGAYLIARNRDHIVDEAYNDAINAYPSLNLNNIDERKCRRDINLIITGLLRDLVLGGNSGIVTFAELYFTGTTLTGVPASELPATRYAFTAARDLCIQAMRNWYDSSGNAIPAATYTPIPRFTDNTILGDPAGNPTCAQVEATITTLFGILDDILGSVVAPGATPKNTGTLLDTAGLYTYADSIIQDFNGNTATVRATYDDYPIIEASPYTQNASIISKLGGGGALVDGSKVKQPNCPFPGLNLDGSAKFPNQGKSMVASAFTIVSEGGVGYKIIEDGYVQLVSVFCIFTADGILAESGGYASVTNSASNFGIYSLRARGFRRECYDFDQATISNVSSTPTGRTIFSVSGLGREPLEHYVVKIDGYVNANPEIEYFVDAVEGVTVGPPFSAQLTLESGSGGPAQFKNIATDQIASLASLVGANLKLHRPSIVNSSSHTWEYAGSGTTYLALPENGGTKVEANEQVSEDYGRTYVSGTDELGDFKVGTFARIENRTGNITFTGTVTISEVEFLKLKGGDVVVTGFDASNTLGGANSSDSKLPTQKAVKDFITNALGPYINKPFSTNPVPRALVELTDSGKISEDQIPPLRPFQVFTVANQNERLAIEGALAGDIAIQQDTSTSFILNNDNESLFASFAVDPTLQFTLSDVFTGSITGGKIQATEYRQGVVFQVNITDGGSGYISPPIVTVSGGNPQAGAVDALITTEIANGQVVIMNIELFNGYIGGKGYTTPPTITIAAPAGSGTQATANALIESRLYGEIVNNIKITDTDTILSSDLPAETINITRVINTSSSNNNNWVSLSSNQIAASDITSGVISTARLASNASGVDSAANSFTFLRGDQAYAPAVQTVKGPETRYFAQLKLQANSGASQLIFETNSNFLKGHDIKQITGIQADTNIDGVLTESGETTITLDKFITATLPAGTVLEFNRGKSPLTVESSQTQGGFVEEVVIQNGGSGFTDGQYFNLPLVGGSGSGLRVNIIVNAGAVTDVTIVSGGQDYGQNTSQSNVDFIVSSAPAEIGGGSGLILLGKVTTVLRQFANVTIDVDRVSDLTTSGDPYGTLGVARFLKQQFLIGEAGNGSVQINTGPDSGLDADTLDGAQGDFYLNAGNMNAGFLPIERLNGTYNINIANQSGSTLRLKTSTNSPTGNPSPNEFSAGIIADTKNNSADGLNDGGTRHVVLTIRNGGADFDATFGGVRQLAFTDANADVGAGMFLRGSFNSPANSFGNWHEIWHSGNDGTLSGLDADRLDSRQGTWYQSAQHMDFGYLSNERLPILQREKDFLSKLRVMDWTGNVRVNVLVRDELLNTTPFVPGQPVNLYTASGISRGTISITKVEPNQDTNDAANNYTLITGSLTSGDFNSFDDAEFIGTGGVGNAFQFQNWSVSQVDDNADGDIDGTYEVISGESVSGNARLRLGRADGQPSDPSIFFRSSALVASDYNVAFIATGGGSTNGSGSLETKVGNNNAFTINGNRIWNEGNITFNSSNIAGSGVIRDQSGNFSAGTITADLNGSALNNVLKTGDTMTGALVISNVVAANQALQVSGRADFLSNITVAEDFAVDTDTLFVDASKDSVGINVGTTLETNIGLDVRGGSIAGIRVQGNSSAPDATSHMLYLDSGRDSYFDDANHAMMFLTYGNGGITPGEGSNWVFNGRAADRDFIFRNNSSNKLTIQGNGGLVIENSGSNAGLTVDNMIVTQTGLTLGTTANNNEAPIFFLGNTGGADGSGGYLSNFRVGNGIIGNDIFEITPNDGTQGATSWKSTPALAIQGSNNRVAINSTTFSGQDNTDPNNIITRFYALNIEGNFNINNGNLFVDNKPFVTSRWTEAPNNTDIYRPTKVGINFSSAKNPTESLDVEGSINVSGTLKANGQEQWIDQYGVVKVASATINENLTIASGLNAFSFGPIGVGANNIVTIQTGATWVIL
tara:strand:- start:1583 stop:11662 length:10080 start_codon:yes stop_codon:yes gene_type:complete